MRAPALGALATLRASLQVSIMGIMTEITTTTIVITTKGQSDGEQLPVRPPVDRTCIFEQMPVSELAVMVQGCRQLPRQDVREKTHGGDHGKERIRKTSILGDR